MRPESWRIRVPRSPLICPKVLVDLMRPEPHTGSFAAAPVQVEVVSKSAVTGVAGFVDIVNDGWLKTLYASPRRENLTRSVIGIFFCSAMSKLLVPGPRNTFARVIPGVLGEGITFTCGMANAALLMYCSVVWIWSLGA